MAKTSFSGPVQSDNGFIGALSGTVNATTLTATSGTITNLLCTSLTVGSTKIGVAVNAASGAVSDQVGFIQVLVGATTAYIALYKSVTV
jgi:uncharacterized membrane protein